METYVRAIIGMHEARVAEALRAALGPDARTVDRRRWTPAAGRRRFTWSWRPA